ncbi:reverse transcriptase domain-containing protein [Tanacetum coccineum]
MNAMANTTPIVTTVTKTATKEKTSKETNAAPRVNILNFCEEHYEEILPVIMDKIHRDKRKEVYTRLDFEDNTKKSRRMREGSQNSSAGTLSARYRNPSGRLKVRDRLEDNDGNVFGRLGHRRDHSHSRPHRRDSSLSRDCPRSRDCSRGIEESYGNTCSSHRTRARHRHHYHDKDRSRIMKRRRESESPLSRVSESSTSDGGHWKSKSKGHKPTDEDDLAVPWDPEDHVKTFQAAAQVERWAMPTWCHMFNSTLIGTARVWFDKLPPKSIDGYKNLKATFLAYFMQQNKYIKDPVEIHNIKQKDRETIEDFIERFKVKTGGMKGVPECIRISGFMHGVNNPELTKRLNEHVPKTMEEMMTITTAFIRGETAAASKKKGHTPWKAQDQPKRYAFERKSDFQGQSREGRGSSRFTSLIRTPKEILAAEGGKFKPPPPMVTPVEKRSSNKFCDFHNDKGHNTDECLQLKKQIEELVTTRQKVTQSFARVSEITFPPLTTSKGTEGPLVIEAEIG